MTKKDMHLFDVLRSRKGPFPEVEGAAIALMRGVGNEDID